MPSRLPSVQALEDGEWVLNVDCHDLHSFNPELYKKLVRYPSECMLIMQEAIDDLSPVVADMPGAGVQVPDS
jgi:DNA replicative helicase MCM subunit Mcm2 (Cdc46/Mcm family)